MFASPAAIADIVDLLERRQASLWHACQLQDLAAYIQVGGIPSRSLLEQSRLRFTPFVTDASDRSKGLWSKVFLNLDDFGRSFARGWDATPNPYGPIALQVSPRALLAATDVAVCLRSAGASDFDRSSESLATVEEVDRIYLHPADAPVFERMEVRFGEELRRVFAPKHPNATSAEVSLSIDPELVSFRHVLAAWIDPLMVDGNALEERVRALTAGLPAVRVRERWMTADRRLVLTEVVGPIADGPPLLRLIAGRRDLSEGTRAWAAALQRNGLQWQFERWGRYLLAGTLIPPTTRPLHQPRAGTVADGAVLSVPQAAQVHGDP